MKRLQIAILVGVLIGAGRLSGMDFSRGDSNADGVLNIADSVFTLNYLYQDGPTPECLDAADVNDDGAVDIADVIFSLTLLPGPMAPLLLPAPQFCAPDPTADSLDCASFAPCP